MTSAPSIARVAPNRRRRSHRPLLLVALPLVVLAAIVVGCTTTPTTPGSTDGGAVATDGGPQGTGPTPKPTAWPGPVVAAIIALGAADGQFEAMGNDMQTAVNDNNPHEMLLAVQSSLTFLQGNQQNIPHLQGYSETMDLGNGLAKAYADMIAGLQKIQSSLTAGDSAGVQAGFQLWSSGGTEYAAVRQDLSDKSEQAIFMQRILTR